MTGMEAELRGPLKTPIGTDWKPARRLCVFFTWGDSFVSREISRITGGPSHTGIGYELQDSSQVLYENLSPDGFSGPKPLSKLRSWARAKSLRRAEIYWLELDPMICERKHVVAHTWVGLVGYAELKLLSFLWLERFGKWFGFHMRPSWNRWVCSTSIACILSPEINLATPERSLSECTPKSAREAVLKMKIVLTESYSGGLA